MKVKICGITSLEDAIPAVEAGADMLGFNFYPKSSRYIERELCKEIINALRANDMPVLNVGVFVNAPLDEIKETMSACGLDLAQLSGDEQPEILKALGEKGFKGIRPQSLEEAQTALREYPLRSRPPALLIDAYRPGEYGGTGQTGDWGLAAKLTTEHDILLAGGLKPENVGAAVQQVQPWGVDVASGVESEPGIKDQQKVLAFIQNAQAAIKEEA
ncbi:MAG: phosphoribosylanthranilate isomerase [Chloroflexi bacterium]|nr:MAG: phosphoribosylanthranilate isomerase [Chloroflexota bacterium]MBL1192721.1 phosphoribosylanthranilate isomerase [Chloroflexota bacterium]NOH10013.1 phosphoribosylanthranilate isomerase [Chloroflexota bacterium]